MKPSDPGRWLLRGLLALAVAVGFAVLCAALLSRYAGQRLADAESRLRGSFETAAVPPPPSSAASLELTTRFVAVARRLPPQRLGPAHRWERELAPPTAAPAEIELLLAAAETPLAHELLAAEELTRPALRASWLLARVAAEAERAGDPALQARSAEALASVAGAFYRQASLLGLLVGIGIEEREIEILQRLVQEPGTPAPVLERVAALVERPPPPLRSVWAHEALAQLEYELPVEETGLGARLAAPVATAFADLLQAHTVERFGEFGHQLDQPLTEFLAAEPDWMSQPGPLDALAGMALSSTWHAAVQAKILAVARALGTEALAARRGDRGGQLTHPEVVAALDRYWGLAEGQRPPARLARTRDLLIWRVPPSA